jgi:hypothetical protein
LWSKEEELKQPWKCWDSTTTTNAIGGLFNGKQDPTTTWSSIDQSGFDGIENEDDKRKVKFIRNRESGSYCCTSDPIFHNISKFGIVQSESNYVKNQMCFWIFGEPKSNAGGLEQFFCKRGLKA